MDDKKIRCWPNYFTLIRCQHVFEIIQLRPHGKKIVDHLICRFKISMNHRNLQCLCKRSVLYEYSLLTLLIWSKVGTRMEGSQHSFSIVIISSFMAWTLSRVLRYFFSPALVVCSCSLTPILSRASIDAFSFSSFFRKADTLTRSSGDWRYSPIACAAEADPMGTAIVLIYCRVWTLTVALGLEKQYPFPGLHEANRVQNVMRDVHISVGNVTSVSFMRFTATTTRLTSSAIFVRRPYLNRNYTCSDPIESDVVIIGGGVAGLALASALGKHLQRYISLNN